MNTSKHPVAIELLDIARNELSEIEGIEALTDGDIAHLAQLSRILEDKKFDHRFRLWFLDVLDHELRRRRSDGEIEAGNIHLRTEDWGIKELSTALMRTACLLGFDTLSKAERDFIQNIIQILIRSVSVRATTAVCSDVQLFAKEDVADLLSVKPSEIVGLVRKGIIPRPIRLAPKLYRWHSSDINTALGRLIQNTN